MKKILVVAVAGLLLSGGAVFADSSLRPEQGTAVGTVMYKCIDYDKSGKQVRIPVTFAVNISFWNVGAKGGAEYKDMSVKLSDAWNADVCGFTDKQKDFVVTFSGGPNGTAKNDKGLNGELFTFINEGRDITISGWEGNIIGSAAVRSANTLFPFNPWDPNTTSDDPQNLKGKDDTNYIYENFAGGGFSDLSGEVSVSLPNPDGTYDEESWSFAKLDGATLPVGTHIRTGDNSSALISFEGQNTFQMGSNSELIIAPNSNVPGPIGMLYGNLKANIKKMAKDGSMEIEMSQAVAGIKGTRFILTDTGKESTIEVTEGTVAYRSKANQQVAMIGAGEAMTATAAGLGQKTTFDAAQKDAEVLAETSVRTSSLVWYLIPVLVAAGIGGWYWMKKRTKISS